MFAGVPFRSANGSQLVLSRCQEDESMCYVLKVEDNENGKAAVCSSCLQISENSPVGIQKPLERCKITDGSVLDLNPWNFHHLHGCRPKKYNDVFRRGENSSGRRSKRLAAAKANVLMDTDNVSEDDAALYHINNSSDSILETVAGGERDSSTYPVTVVQKKTPITYMYRPPGDRNLCYKFYKHKGHYLICTTCNVVYNREPANNKKETKIFLRKFAGCYMLDDPSLNHVPDCQPQLYSELMKKYRLLQEDESNQQSGFFLEKIQRKQYCGLFRLSAPDDTSKCYLFNQHRVYGSSLVMICATCKHLNYKEWRRNSDCKAISPVHYRCFTLNGLRDDPTKHHRSDCEPLLYKDVIKNFEITDGETAKCFLQSGRVSHQDNDMDDSMNAPKRIRLSEDDSFMDSTQEIVTDDSMILEESGAKNAKNSNLDDQVLRPISLKVKADVAKGPPAHEIAVNVSNSMRYNANAEENDQIEVPNSVVNRLPSIVLDRGFADNENQTKCNVDDNYRRAKAQPERSSQHADTPELGLQPLFEEYKTQIHTLSFSANGFTQDEMSLKIVGEQIVVKFQRMIASPFSTDCTSRVQHFVKVQFREPVDLETVEGTVKNNKVYVTASYR